MEIVIEVIAARAGPMVTIGIQYKIKIKFNLIMSQNRKIRISKNKEKPSFWGSFLFIPGPSFSKFAVSIFNMRIT
ncbi:hypothetical protein [Clostridium sp. YIM B02555]|uniref:hypothetical protein n=1 Tax=Clostridium sp. YIM B02555 TaxID=2911968 RepID=UPI001EED56D1|nr:hypothetical protein [Clostridium sp. YIM B02555]